MSSNSSDWQRLVSKTKQRPLVNMNAIIDHNGGLILRRKHLDILMLVAIAGVLGGSCVGVSFSKGVTYPLAAQIVGGILLLLAAYTALFRQKILLLANGELIASYGFFLFPSKLTIDPDSVVLEQKTGAETSLHSSLRGFKIILLRHNDTGEVAHLGYTMTTDEALFAFDAMSKFLAAGEKSASAVVELDNGFVLQVDTHATWAAGQRRNYMSKLTVVDQQTIEINRQTRREDRSTIDRKGDVYPIRIEATPSRVQLIYSDHNEVGIDADDCAAIQICKEEIPQRRTRYEINLIEGVHEATRHNLMSFDHWPQKSVAHIVEAAENIAAVLELDVENHL